jgi:hypothetical protein
VKLIQASHDTDFVAGTEFLWREDHVKEINTPQPGVSGAFTIGETLHFTA